MVREILAVDVVEVDFAHGVRTGCHVYDSGVFCRCARGDDVPEERVGQQEVAQVVGGELGLVTVRGLVIRSKHYSG